MAASIKEVRDRIGSVSNTKKITEAMKLVAAAKVRRAQEAVVNGRPFAENLVKVGAAPRALRMDSQNGCMQQQIFAGAALPKQGHIMLDGSVRSSAGSMCSSCLS